ncbi:neutral zinc metallopeptidase [soil metagenome]
MKFRKGAKLDRSQVEDLRGRRVGGGAPMALGGGGIVTLIIVVAIVLLGGNPLGGGGGLGPLDDLAGQTAGTGGPGATLEDCKTGQDANEREDCRILAVVNSVQAYWSKTVRNYSPAKTRFFDGSVSTGCGNASSNVGPFYCPRDRYIYIDLGFFDELESRFGASGGPLAEAYVIAHEYGHHVQNLTGVLQKAQSGDTGPQSNAVRVELQADCYAGAWVANAKRTGLIVEITRKDIQDGLSAAAAVGDDRIQEKAQGRVTPESWTHGSAEQRQSWFVRGLEGGGPNSCDTFSGRV